MATTKQEVFAARRKRKRKLAFLKLIVFLVIFGNIGLLTWFVVKKRSAGRVDNVVEPEGPGDVIPAQDKPAPTVKRLPRIDVSARSLDFGETTTAAGARLALKIGNRGNARLQIKAITAQGDGFSLVEPFQPRTLDMKETMTVEVGFVPTKLGASEGRLIIASTDPNEAEKTVALTASYRSAESRDREIGQARDVLRKAKEDLNTAYALLTFESTNKSLMKTRRDMGRTKFEQAWPNYERANEVLRSLDPSRVDTEFYVDGEDVLHKRSAEGH